MSKLTYSAAMVDDKTILDFPILDSTSIPCFWEAATLFFNLLDNRFWVDNQTELEQVTEWLVTALENRKVSGLVILRALLKTLGK